MKGTLNGTKEIANGVWGNKDVFVNYYFIQDKQSGEWFLIDAGMKWSSSRIKKIATHLFGSEKKPSAIILTHGHFDHVGALKALVAEWQVPVYAHELEIPYLTGKASYPPADTTVGGGLMTSMSWMYPTSPINVGNWLRTIPASGRIPGLSEWRVIETPGHSPGHISLFRETDDVLIAGDAIVTTKQESAIDALLYPEKLSGPPKYLTCNWASAKISALKISGLQPSLIASGHGNPMTGEELKQKLEHLAIHFDELAVPQHGRYVDQPAVTNSDGVVYLPPSVTRIPAMVKVIGAAALLVVGLVAYFKARKKLSY